MLTAVVHVVTEELVTVCPAAWAMLLTPYIPKHEQEAATGELAAGNAEFQQGIKRAVPLGWVFKGFPQHFAPHVSAEVISKALLEEPQVRYCMQVLDQ